MKRCCLFFLAFVTAVFLAVFTGAFENRQVSKKNLGDSRESSIASHDEGDLPGKEHGESPDADITKNTKP